MPVRICTKCQTDVVVIGDGAIVDILDAVCHTTGLRELFYQLLNLLRALSNLLNEFDVTGRELVGFLGIENSR